MWPNKLKEVLSYIDSNYSGGEISWGVLERKFQLSHWGLHKIFITNNLPTPRDYANKKRVNFAQNLIRKSGLSNKEIAFKAGFGSVSQCNRVFREINNMSITQFRAVNSFI